jgi:hypothetical protein
MGMSWSDYLGIGVQAGGAIASTVGGPWGMAAAGLGTAVSSGLSLLDKNKQIKLPGATPEQEKGLFYTGELARKAMATTGVSANTAGRVAQAGRESTMADIAEANTFSQRLSPLDRMMLTKKLTEKAQKTQSVMMENLTAYAEGRETQNLSVAGNLSSNLVEQATELERDRTNKYKQELLSRQKQFQSYTASMTDLAKVLSGSLFDPSKKEPAKPATPDAPIDITEKGYMNPDFGSVSAGGSLMEGTGKAPVTPDFGSVSAGGSLMDKTPEDDIMNVISQLGKLFQFQGGGR